MDKILSMNNLNFQTPKEILGAIVLNMVKKRKSMGLSQFEIAQKSGVSFGSVKRFENKFEISLSSLVKIAFVLNCEDEFLNLFKKKYYSSILEVIDEQEK